MNRPFWHCLALCIGTGLFSAQATEVIKIDIYDQRVAIVNTEAISKRDVEDRMGVAADRLYEFKKQKQALKTWSDDDDAKWTALYVESFREALRRLVRDRLMLQYFTIEKMSIDDKMFQKRLSAKMKELREAHYQFNVAELTKYIKESMMLEEFRGKFDNQLEFPKKPDVEKYYQDHIAQHQRKAGVKVRVIRIYISVEDKLTGTRKVRDNAYGMLEEIRRDIVDFGALFAEVAKTKTDDEEARERGGLVLSAGGDPYIVPEEYNTVLAAATRDLKVGEVSRIFEYGEKCYAIAMVEDRRAAGPEPLDSKLYEELYNEMYRKKQLKKEDEWFRSTLARTLVMQIKDGHYEALPLDFFFPEDKDKKKPDFVAGQPQPADSGTPDSKKSEKGGEKKPKK
jgi:hypothetical protein